MFRLILLGAIVFFVGRNSAAQTFSRIYNGYGRSYAGGYLSAPASWLDDDTSTVFLSRHPSSNNDNFILRRTNKNGNVIDSNYYSFLDGTIAVHTKQMALKRLSKTRLACFVDIIFDTLGYSKLYLLNNNLDTIKSATIKSDTIGDLNSYDILIDEGIITVVSRVYRFSYGKHELVISQFDTTLSALGQTTVAVWPGHDYGYFPARIMRLHNAYYISGRCIYSDTVESFLIKTNLKGEMLWDRRFKPLIGNSATLTLDHFNDTIVLAHSLSPTLNEVKIWISQLDTAGNILNETILPLKEKFLEPNDMVHTGDGNFIVAGNYRSPVTGKLCGFLIKFDKYLKIIWHRKYYYQSNLDENRLWRLHQRSDGSLLATGTLRAPNYNLYSYVWLLSLDVNGCLAPSNCGVLTVEEENLGYLVLYPNPAKGEVTLLYPTLNSRETVTLYDMLGKTYLTQELQFENGSATLNLPVGISSGCYFVHLKTEQGNFTSKLVLRQ